MQIGPIVLLRAVPIQQRILLAVIAFMTAMTHVPSGAQVLRDVQFPATQETSITDCVTPTTLTLPGGETVTFRGGQFIHYEDANFTGTMYATSSAAGCQRMPPDYSVYPPPPGPASEVTVTFSQPMFNLTVQPYNFLGPQGSFEGFGPGMALSFWDVSGSEVKAMAGGFPALLILPDPFPYPFPGLTWPPFSMMAFRTFQWDTARREYYKGDWQWGITSLRIPQGPPDTVKFDYSGSSPDDGKVLLSTAPWDANYLSKYQVRGASPLQVRISGTLVDRVTNQPKAGTVYLRLLDPPDIAAYRGGDAASGDNDGPAATLMGGSITPGGATQIQTDSQGHFGITLSTDSRVAGDNYQIEGSPNENFQCGTTGCTKSGIFALWKRIYIEQENMFVQGSFLNDVAAAGSTDIFIEDPTPFQNLLPGTALELVHGDTGHGEGYYFDFVGFSALRRDINGHWLVEIDPASAFSRDYGAQQSTQPSPLIDIMRDGIGIVPAGTYASNDAYVAPLFGTMFVDIAPAPQAVTEVPHRAMLDRNEQRYFSIRWLQAGTGNPFSRQANPNLFHRLAVANAPLVTQPGGVGADLGITNVSGGTNYSLIFAQMITDLTAGLVSPFGTLYSALNAYVLNGETTVHETVHFWVHDPTGSDGHGHCRQQSYRSQLNCLVHEPYMGAGLADGLVDLHYVSHGADSEYMTVRRAADPVPQQ